MTNFISPDSWRDAGSYFSYNGQSIFYRDSGGDGPTLVCIHGFPTASWDWHRLWPDLTARFRVIAPDMIGFGFSDKPAKYPYSIMDQATLHEALLNELGVQRAHIFAHDYGDTVTQELLARYNERNPQTDSGLNIQTVCLLNGGIFPEAIRPRLIQKALLSPLGSLVSRCINEPLFRRSFIAIFGESTQPNERELNAFWRLIDYNDGTRVAHRIIEYLHERSAFRDRWVGALRATTVPLRFIVGAADPVSGEQMAARYCELIPEPDIVSLDDIGHYPQIEAPDAVRQAFLSFVGDTESYTDA